MRQEGIWRALWFFGFPQKIINLLQALYSKSYSVVRVNGDLTEWFQTTVGVRQGCVISTQLFNILFEVVMLYATHNVNIGAKIQSQLISNLRFADDITIPAESASDLQNLVDKVYENSSNLGLKINIAKTEVQVTGKKESQIKININGANLEQVENFIYLGGSISQKGGCTEYIKGRIGKALGAVQRLQPI